jgi:microcystin-dependent protein
LASRRVARTKSLSGYLGSISQELGEARLRNFSTSVASGSISASNLSEEVQILDKAIQSDNYAAGADGWRIDGSGNAEFGNVFVRGDINAESGTIGYWNISKPLVDRKFGTTTLHGTFLESFDHGPTDVDATSGTYVSLFKSYEEVETNFIAFKLDSNKVTLTIPGHTFAVGDPIVVQFEDVTWADLETTADAPGTVSEVSYDTVVYSVGTYNEDGADDEPLTDVAGTIQIYYEDVAGLYLRDYGKREFDYGYFSNKGIQFNSPYEVNIIKNPSFEYATTENSVAISESSWLFPASSLASVVSPDGNIIIEAGGPIEGAYSLSSGSLGAMGLVVWGTSEISSEYLIGTIDFNSINHFRLNISDKTLYFGFTMSDGNYPAGYPSTYTRSYELSEIKFVFSNSESVDLYDVLTDECQAEWDAAGGESWLQSNKPYRRELPIPRLSSAKLVDSYSLLDPSGYVASSDFYIYFPAVLYGQTTDEWSSFVKTVKVTNSDLEPIGFMIDSLYLSTVERFFYGNQSTTGQATSLSHGWWPSDNTDSVAIVDEPRYASVETSTNWIDLDLSTSTFNLNQVDYLGFDSHSTQTLFSEPYIVAISGFDDLGYSLNYANTTALTHTRVSPGVFKKEYGDRSDYYSVSSDYLLGDDQVFFRTEAFGGADTEERYYSSYIEGAAGNDGTYLVLQASYPKELGYRDAEIPAKIEINRLITDQYIYEPQIKTYSSDFSVYVYDSTQYSDDSNPYLAIQATYDSISLQKPVRILGTMGDVSLSSSAHPLQIGDTSGNHLKVTSNEIQVVSSSNTAANLAINPEGGSAVFGGPIVKSGGTSSQFLKADGSVDTNTYLTGPLNIASVPTGAVVMWVTSVPELGWLICDGSAVSRSTYLALWDVLRNGSSSSPYGNGNGSTTFNLPDLRGKIPLGQLAASSLGTATITIATPGVLTATAHGLAAGQQVYLTTTGSLPTGLTASTVYFVATVPSADTLTLTATKGGSAIATSGTQSGTHTLWTADFASLGQTGGSLNHTLTVAEMPSHNHSTTLQEDDFFAATGTTVALDDDSAGSSGTQAYTSSNTGSTMAHLNIQPYLVMNYIIKT